MLKNLSADNIYIVCGHTDKTKKGSYEVKDYYDSTGRASAERHQTDHGRSDKHSNPHDHTVDWSNGYPNLSPPNIIQLVMSLRLNHLLKEKTIIL